MPLGMLGGVSSEAPAEPRWAEAIAECRDVLAGLIAIDTSNPPGNEIHAARYLDAILAREGIECRTFEPAPGRGNLVARLKGSGRLRPLLLLGHLDVVGVERERWTSEPFRMAERDGYYYGRGVIDDKGMVAAEALTLMLLKRLGVPLERDIILLAECDEEAGGTDGVRWMLDRHREAIDAEFAINEGGRTTLENGRVTYVGVQSSEKRGINYTLIATGTSGHASMPRLDNAIAALARAIPRATEPFPVELTLDTRRFFETIAKHEPPELRSAMEQLADPARRKAAGAVVSHDLMYNAMLRNTVSPTVLKGGFRSNVIPETAEVTLNVRLLPGADPDAFRAELERRIADPAVRVTFHPPSRPEAPSVPFDGPVIDAVRRVVARVTPGADVVPLLSTGATDSAQLRSAGISAYGLLPLPLTSRDAARMHGSDERMPIESLGTGLKLLYGVALEIATGRTH